MMTRAHEVTFHARLYALVELARRAGVTPDVFNRWGIRREENAVVVSLDPGGSGKCIHFPVCDSGPDEIGQRDLVVAKATWMKPPGSALKSKIPEFTIPFLLANPVGPPPLFRAESQELVKCSFDLLASVVLTLSRAEEATNSGRDQHDRFQAKQSLAARHGFLDRPIVDEYGLAFEQVLQYLIPRWRCSDRRLRVKLSHDIDLVGLPFSLQAALGHALVRRNAGAAFRDILSSASPVSPIYLALVRQIAKASLDCGLDSAIYWKASSRTKYDSGYDLSNRKVRNVIELLLEWNIEMGVHPGYDTYRSIERLEHETEIVRNATGSRSIGGRQHFLRWSPETWIAWEKCGLLYDSTVGYADQIGFRAGTCVPYRPWLMSLNRAADLLEIPLIVMDGTLVEYMGLSHEQSASAARVLLERCRTVGGVFTLLWHNSTLIDPRYGQLYPRLLQDLKGNGSFDWRNELPFLTQFDFQKEACSWQRN